MGEMCLSTPWGRLPLKCCPQLLTALPQEPMSHCRGLVAIPTPRTLGTSGSALPLGGEGAFPPPAVNLPSELSVWSKAKSCAVLEAHSSRDDHGGPRPGASLLASTGLLFLRADFSRNPYKSGRHAVAWFIARGLPVLYSTVCSPVPFVCIIIWSSTIRLSYFASCKNSTEIRFDLFPTTEIIVSCLHPGSS